MFRIIIVTMKSKKKGMKASERFIHWHVEISWKTGKHLLPLQPPVTSCISLRVTRLILDWPSCMQVGPARRGRREEKKGKEKKGERMHEKEMDSGPARDQNRREQWQKGRPHTRVHACGQVGRLLNITSFGTYIEREREREVPFREGLLVKEERLFLGLSAKYTVLNDELSIIYYELSTITSEFHAHVRSMVTIMLSKIISDTVSDHRLITPK